MTNNVFTSFWLVLAFVIGTLGSEPPLIRSLSPGGELIWTNGVPGLISVVERSTNLAPGSWEPAYYDWGIEGWKTNRLSDTSDGQSFYRVAVITNPPDPTLVMHLSFDNDFASGTVLDVSGHGNHGLRYGRPAYPTNWPSLTVGPDGSQAARFQSYADGYGLYGRSGDYIGIPITTNLTPLPKATIALWAYYYTSAGNVIQNDHTSTLMNSGKDFPGTFFLGRNYANYTSFIVITGPATIQEPIVFPDRLPVGNSGGWHHYVITFDNGIVNGFFDGALIGSGAVSATALVAAGRYIGMSCWTFNMTPELDLSVDGHPNNAWINGAVDDVRIYNRVLTADEIHTLYLSFDKFPPSVPANIVATAASSSQVILRWEKSTDNYTNAVPRYTVRRNGNVIGTTSLTSWFDEGLAAGSSNVYTLQASDPLGNVSRTSAEIPITTLSTDGVDFTVDDADGEPWVSQSAPWLVGTASSGTITGMFSYSFLALSAPADKGRSVVFRPSLPQEGNYSVYLWYPGAATASHLFASAVPVDVVHSGTTNTLLVNQRGNFAQWRLLGQFPLNAGTNDHVRIRTDGTSDRYVLGDAVRFVK